MNNSVVIKGNKSGITVLLDRDLPFAQLLDMIGEKFKESAKFFGKAKMALKLEGRQLSSEEEYKILQTIAENSQLEIICIVDEDEQQEALYKDAIAKAEGEDAANTGQFYKGTLRSGQVVESEGSITILGDVNPGGKVMATGNIIILGALKGTAYAGITGNTNAFVVALEMAAIQIRIGDIIARSTDGKSRAVGSQPMIAYVESDNIYIDPLNKDVLNEINFI